MALKLILFCLPLASLCTAYDWNDYYSLEETEEFLYNLSAADNLAETEYYSVGQTYNGRDMSVFKIIFKESDSVQGVELGPKPSILVEAGIYGNEWIAPSVATYIIKRLLAARDARTLSTIKVFNWYIMPFSNPDGYDYSFTTDPMWRKNRRRFSKLCYGVDLNRNFNFHWNEDGSSRDPCSSVYAGPEAKSENETQTFSRLVDSEIDNLKLFISLQGYGQKFVYPHGYSNILPPDTSKLNQVGNIVIESMKNSYGTKYSSGSMFNAIHQVSGNAMDWIASKGIQMAFTQKLRPSVETYQVPYRRVPREQIFPTAVETYNSLLQMADQLFVDLIVNVS